MKKLLLFLAFVLVMQTAPAQINNIYLSNGVVLTGNQWHFDDYSVMEANNGIYVIVTPNGYNYYQLQQFDKGSFERAYADVVYSMKPYIYNNQFGWYIRGHYRNYFYYPNGNVIIMSYEPVFYNFNYQVARLTYLDLRYWHWRTAGLYHHLWHKPHHYHHPPQHHHHNHHSGHNGHHYEPAKHSNGHVVPPSRNGNVRRPTSTQVSRSTTITPSSSRVSVTRSSTTSSRSTSVTRPVTTPSRSTSVTRPATQPSRSTSVTRPATQPSRSTSVTRPATQPSRSTSVTRQVGTSSSRSGGSSRTRR